MIDTVRDSAVDKDSALACLLRELRRSGYRFVTPTPLTHGRVLKRRTGALATTLRDVFGWNMPFASSAVSLPILKLMDDAGILQRASSVWRSAVRIASINGDLFMHSAYPTTEADAVFFGPDTYRFASFIRQSIRAQARPPFDTTAGTIDRALRILDVGCGSGAGAIIAVRVLEEERQRAERYIVTMNDINPLALRYTAVNAAVAEIPVTIAQGDALSAVEGEFELIVSNPPYLDDDAERAYRHGGAGLGRALGLRMASEAISRLAPGGTLLLYTGVAMLDERDPFREELTPFLEAACCEWSYTELDPDVFGEELDRPVYAHAERIAAIGLVATSCVTRS